MNHTIVRLIAILGTALAFAEFAQAESVPSQNPQKVEKARKGTLYIAAAMNIGGLTLEPGDYEVKQVNSAAGPVVRFTRLTYNAFAEDSASLYEWETVGEVRVTLQTLTAKAKHTGLMRGSDGAAIGLEISGNRVDYLF